MSYILDALKKAERERGLANVPTLEAVHDIPQRNMTVRWMALGMFSLCIIALLCLFYLKTKTKEPKSIASSSTVLQTHSIPLPAAVTTQPVLPPVEVPVAPPKPIDKDQAMTTPPLPANGPMIVAKPDAAARVIAAKQMRTASADGTVLIEPVKASIKGEDSSPTVPEQSVSLQDALASMNMSIHLYADNKEERLVFINGKAYHEGDYLEPGILLESITPEGAVLRSGDEHAVLRPGPR
jgi:general secretion pathway protein B